MRLVTLLAQIVVLLQEQNQLLREMHVGLTGRPALTPRQTSSDRPGRIRTGTDVYTRTPLTQDRQDAAAIAERERSASVSPDATSNSEAPVVAHGPIRAQYGSTATERINGTGDDLG